MREVDSSTRAGGSSWWCGGMCSLSAGVNVISVKMSGFEAVNRDSIVATIDVDHEVISLQQGMGRHMVAEVACKQHCVG